MSAAVMQRGVAEMIEDIGQDERLHLPPGTPPLGPGLLVPLSAGDQAVGTLVVARIPQRLSFTALDVRLVSGSLGTPRLHSSWLAQADRTRLAVYEDRDRIARDLDVVMQRLYAAGLRVQGLPAFAGTGSGEGRGALDRSRRGDPRPPYRHLLSARARWRHGVRSRVLQVVTSGASSLGFDPQIRFDGPLDTVVPEPVSTHLLAIIEALSNTARHAKSDLGLGGRVHAARHRPGRGGR